MGGSVMVRTCPLLQELGYRIVGLAVLDVVEGDQLFFYAFEKAA
jgi:hypothetical protein